MGSLWWTAVRRTRASSVTSVLSVGVGAIYTVRYTCVGAGWALRRFLFQRYVRFPRIVSHLNFKKILLKWVLAGMVVHTHNPSTWEVETE